MGLPQTQSVYSVEEYLACERKAEERSEYLDGWIYLMAGESPAHGTICTNLTMLIADQLRGKPCQVWGKDMKVRSGSMPKSRYELKGLYSYPDVLVVCGEPQFHDNYRDVLLNPKVIIEVLSPSTEAYDRGEKFFRYRTFIPELTDYLVVSQTKPLIEHFARQANGLWLMASQNDPAGTLPLPSIACQLPLAAVYDRLDFPAEGLTGSLTAAETETAD